MAESTTEIQNRLKSTNTLDERELEESSNPTASAYLENLLSKKGLKRSKVVRWADINDTYGYEIFKGQKIPGRDKVIRLALAMALNLDETNHLLMLCGHSALYPRIRRDAILLFCIDHSYSLQKTMEELYRLGEDTLN